MHGKTVVCIGGSGGMGRGVAIAALEVGADVIVTSRSKSKADEAARQIGCRGEAIDIYNSESVSDFFTRVGPFSHLMITAGAIGRSSFSETPPDEADRFMQGKLWGTHRCLWHAKDQMEKDGSITLITGGYSQVIDDKAGHVHAAFKAVEAMAQVAAVSLAPIRCNVIRPGFIDSDLWGDMNDEDRDMLRKTESEKTTIGRIVEPVEFGRFAVALMQTNVVTGAIIPVDGGRHLKVAS
ncbi:SDR family oxidoreductase [Parasulfitobacter algicola]|uniref:SDR family oxidoreductase n=1 Tax=Parasulfitobacter algicola TaxID=2614809 RepID=A0ABX2IUD7_9RHOB|nr:SDR family oxidoreductase [Sulfitobacter algicola]NSX54457.1 SDR family oxidoreductase [Sulfitobacter algicola]